MKQIQFKRASSASPKVTMKMLSAGLFVGHLLSPTNGALTESSTSELSASTQRNLPYDGVDLKGLNDGKFNPTSFTVDAPEASTQIPDYAPWFNIKMSSNPCIVHSVFIVNDEAAQFREFRIQGTELYVGDDPIAWNNVSCS